MTNFFTKKQKILTQSLTIPHIGVKSHILKCIDHDENGAKDKWDCGRFCYWLYETVFELILEWLEVLDPV